jgi:hypothetical protein
MLPPVAQVGVVRCLLPAVAAELQQGVNRRVTLVVELQK